MPALSHGLSRFRGEAKPPGPGPRRSRESMAMDSKASMFTHGARPARIALFSGNYNYTLDGANKSLNRLVDHVQRTTGAQVRVYSPTSPTPAFAPVGDLVSVPSVTIPFRRDYRLALGLPAAVRRDVEAFAPDLIHLSAPDLLGAAALKLGRRLKTPVVASLHTLFDSYLDYYGLGGLRALARRRLWQFYGACDFVMTPTPAIGEELRAQNLGVQVRTWARGVDADLFNPARRSAAWRAAQGFDPDRPVIVFLGRLVMEKGLAAFADTIDRLAASGPSPQVLIIGDGPARAWFQERLPMATFAGFLAGEALATALASGDIFLNPSTTETFGNVNLEAMASGLAIVCADAPNTRALLRDGRDAILCAPSDPASYAQALLSLCQDQDRLRQMGAKALDRSAAYRWTEILDEVVDIYAEALDARASAPSRAEVSPHELRARTGRRAGLIDAQAAALSTP
ncbi:glycosyltransferase family 1 protein [Caulobacter sp. SL161]|uniref:glycosyltransferase family 4 protein n=1 Tax=Caulobacter sp. SL161 TaxID=2995156 RepID=UPI0022767567|nr:glycosyltransferase family 1 protein [Caulobacter sp. SL161]MCY1646778.1 glycosyltransferase family 1 protein [Caulobacter sp. SL161]